MIVNSFENMEKYQNLLGRFELKQSGVVSDRKNKISVLFGIIIRKTDVRVLLVIFPQNIPQKSTIIPKKLQ